MLKKRAQSIRYFLFSQYLADGVRIALEIVLPAIICAQFGKLGTGITISLGALGVSISDAPGPVEHKRNGMLYCNIFIFVMALLTGFLNHSIFLTGLLVLFSSFFFTMLTVFGSRANSIGTAALLIMILRISTIASPAQVISDSLLILLGGVWYMVIALLFYRLTPYRPAQRSLGECIHETANFLRIKAELFLPQKNLEEEYRWLVHQQVLVSEKQNEMRELLFKNRALLKESTSIGRRLVVTFVDTVDLYEQIMANWYDYSLLRKKFESTGVLEDVAATLKNISDELDRIGHAIQSNSSYKIQYDLIQDLEIIKNKTDMIGESGINNFLLKKVLVNLRRLGQRVDEILKYFDENGSSKKRVRTAGEYSKFVSHQPINFTVFRNNLTLESSVFRHSLRMMITCGLGFTISKLISYGHHSYWILLTIVIILKPGFSLTKQRNFERFTGTLAGGVIGLVLIAFVHDRVVLFAIMFLFMIGTYTFQRLRYIVMVIFMTPYLLILFNFLGLGILDIAGERLLDTGIASVLAFLASYFLFPTWESKELPGYMAAVLKANLQYLQNLADNLCGTKTSSLEYSLIRKDLFVSTANLAAAFHRMLSEPKSKQLHASEIYNFVVLNHVLSSAIASVNEGLSPGKKVLNSKEIFQPVKRSITLLEKSLQQFEGTYQNEISKKLIPEKTENSEVYDKHLSDQLSFIQKVAGDILKVAFVIAGNKD
ncbi:MAG: FUSC family protein [Bacteroidota bacterium]|nr:FUSC family protein [Bacteroidota bacterium]